jgi:hypothetical protein
MFSIYVGLLTSLFGGMGPLWDEDPVCSSTYLVVSMSGFTINAFAIGMLVSKMTSPDPKIAVSDFAIIKSRHGRLVFQVRFMSAHGNKLTGLNISMHGFLPSVTPEGENFVQLQAIPCDCTHRGGVMPVAITHTIDEKSPIFGTKFTEIKGFIEVVIEGFDENLGCTARAVGVYDVSNIRVGYDFDNMYIVKPFEVLSDQSKTMDMDLSKLSNLVALSPDWKRLTEQLVAEQHLKAEEMDAERRREVEHKKNHSHHSAVF